MYVSLCLCISVSLLCNNDSKVHQVSVFLCVCVNESVRLLDVCVSVSMCVCVHACVRACDLTVTNDPNICLMKQYFCIADFYTIMEQVQEGTGMSF